MLDPAHTVSVHTLSEANLLVGELKDALLSTSLLPSTDIDTFLLPVNDHDTKYKTYLNPHHTFYNNDYYYIFLCCTFCILLSSKTSSTTTDSNKTIQTARDKQISTIFNQSTTKTENVVPRVTVQNLQITPTP